ncbi:MULTISPECIES: dTDP-4-dehydrorhamnose 3,5-epimerase [unclassified Mesorhizobium]|uniref:dTDP-4-dehydrorhamnose 3,5-epimerase n=1 Tax=unclassified Mesorhizobium TaxID=325217 RepID=UPI0033388F4A
MVDVRNLGLEGVLEVTPTRFSDARGFFSETYNAVALAEAGIDFVFAQDNHSLSTAAGVLRGLHYQLPPFAQAKLVRVVRGAILDVAVDIRKRSPSFGKWISLEVSAEKWNQILVPTGFAHGFVTLTENTEVIYKVTNPYSPTQDRGIRFDDPAIGIEWPTFPNGFVLSGKDRDAPGLAEAEIFD